MKRKYEAQKFSRESYEMNDQWGIDKITRYLTARNFFVWDKEVEDYDVDILAEKNGKIFRYEAEVKTGYSFTSVEDFRFPTVSFLGRKKKFHNDEEGFYYCIVSRETECIVYCHSSTIYNPEYKEVKEINTEYRKGLDEFYLVPKELCSFVSIADY